jgi:hypothetical protein
MDQQKQTASPVVIAIASALIPGLGYWLLGQRRRAVYTGGGIVLLFILGVLIAGVRVVSVPGFEEGYLKYVEFHARGDRGTYLFPSTQPFVSVKSLGRDNSGIQQYIVTRQTHQGLREIQTSDPPADQRPLFLYSPISVITDNLWFLGQMLMGPLCAVVGYLSVHTAQIGIDRSYARLADVGSLYTAVAGMLNLMVIVDSAARAARSERKERRP